jgi:hypothetical protein
MPSKACLSSIDFDIEVFRFQSVVVTIHSAFVPPSKAVANQKCRCIEVKIVMEAPQLLRSQQEQERRMAVRGEKTP